MRFVCEENNRLSAAIIHEQVSAMATSLQNQAENLPADADISSLLSRAQDIARFLGHEETIRRTREQITEANAITEALKDKKDKEAFAPFLEKLAIFLDFSEALIWRHITNGQWRQEEVHPAFLDQLPKWITGKTYGDVTVAACARANQKHQEFYPEHP